ncbi:HotDog domain-containing protein [Radiomyces spectabilis]|uniref:HotDog domain-containing protein n=1 Tax=Radiomyces spectabilis TaxID=64574 RepID=UPI002220F0FD|nr:HotDog domain-containing protein [Radiomyces spectabilis]KAI8384934.1 HotDog domain-containing protein [Radiomyces spectabilis]
MSLPQSRLAAVKNHITASSNASSKPSRKSVNTYRERSDYKYFAPVQTRWADNDQYGHVNNAIYYVYMDAVINAYLIEYCKLSPTDVTQPLGLVVTSHADFYSAASYPSMLQAGLVVTRIGKSSITYRVGIFDDEQAQACVVGGFTHVVVDPMHRRPVQAIPEDILNGVQAILSPENVQ